MGTRPRTPRMIRSRVKFMMNPLYVGILPGDRLTLSRPVDKRSQSMHDQGPHNRRRSIAVGGSMRAYRALGFNALAHHSRDVAKCFLKVRGEPRHLSWLRFRMNRA